MKLKKMNGQDLVARGIRTIGPKKQIGSFEELDFDTFDDFLFKYALDEITLPVCIVPPDDEGDYWLIQVALPMKNTVIDCCIWKATTHAVSRYRAKSFRLYKLAMGITDQSIVIKD